MSTIGHIITQGGKPCTLHNVAGTKRGGVIMPGAPVAFFGTPRDAKRALKRTRTLAENLRGSLVDKWPLLAPIFSAEPYEIVPVVRSHTGEPQPKTEAAS